jgi:hypothetical protein
MAKRSRQQGEAFAEVVARVTSDPPGVPRVPEGRRGNVWGDRSGRAFAPVTNDLSPTEARTLAVNGAQVVYDACGCGGAECRLDWLAPHEVASAGPPVKHPSKDGRADLEHWTSSDGRDLVVVAVEVSWGSRILGDTSGHPIGMSCSRRESA